MYFTYLQLKPLHVSKFFSCLNSRLKKVCFYHDCSNARKTTKKSFFLLIYVFWLTNENLILTIEGSRGWKFRNIKVCPKEKFHFNFLIFFIFRLVVCTHYNLWYSVFLALCQYNCDWSGGCVATPAGLSHCRGGPDPPAR